MPKVDSQRFSAGFRNFFPIDKRLINVIFFHIYAPDKRHSVLSICCQVPATLVDSETPLNDFYIIISCIIF